MNEEVTIVSDKRLYGTPRSSRLDESRTERWGNIPKCDTTDKLRHLFMPIMIGAAADFAQVKGLWHRYNAGLNTNRLRDVTRKNKCAQIKTQSSSRIKNSSIPAAAYLLNRKSRCSNIVHFLLVSIKHCSVIVIPLSFVNVMKRNEFRVRATLQDAAAVIIDEDVSGNASTSE